MSAWLFAVWLFGQAAQAPTPPTTAVQVSPASRFEIAGQVSVLADVLPRRDVSELRTQARVDLSFRPTSAVRLKFDGFVEGLVADRVTRTTDAIARAREAWIEFAGSRGDLRAGYGRIVWGRLDEVQPSDVINPIDTARFIFDGRSAARLPVAFVRGRLFTSESVVIEGVLAPKFRSGVFDELQENSSPFNLRLDASINGTPVSPDLVRQAAEPAWGEVSGGGRVLGTIGRVDLAAGVYRGFDGFPLISFDPAAPGQLVATIPRFTMVSSDFETVTGDWAWRGEGAFFVEKYFQRTTAPGIVRGRAIDAGIGFDRRTGAYRVFASVIFHREWSADDAAIEKTDLSLVGSIERQFRRDRVLARVFAVVNPGDASGFVRGLIVWRVRDNIAVEASAAAFPGDGDDTLARFKTRDFLLTRVLWRF